MFVQKVREYLKQKSDVEEAIDNAVVYCIKNGILSNFLAAHRAEVVGVCITEYDEEKTMQQFKDEVEAAKQEVKAAKRESLKSLLDLVIEGYIPIDIGAQKAQLEIGLFSQALEKYRNTGIVQLI